jgi:hypothetical protein
MNLLLSVCTGLQDSSNRISAINTQRDVNTVYRRYSVLTTSNMVLKTAVNETFLKNDILFPNKIQNNHDQITKQSDTFENDY